MKKQKIYRAIGLFALLISALIFISCPEEPEKPEKEDPKDPGKLLILQAYGTGPGGGTGSTGVSHSFVELYNSTDADIDLSGYFLWYADGTRPEAIDDPVEKTDKDWKKIALTGKIPAGGSYLILGDSSNLGTATFRITYKGDMEVTTFNLSNRAFKVALIKGTVELDKDIQNPFDIDKKGTKVEGYIDMVGARNSGTSDLPDQILGYEKGPARNSASDAVRRKSLKDTDNNRGYHPEQATNGTGDFISIRYNGINSGDLEFLRPRNSSNGRWSPFSQPISVAIYEEKIAGGSLVLMKDDTVTLSAKVTPANADLDGVTYSWKVTDQTPAGTLTERAGTAPSYYRITGAMSGTAKVTLTVSGGKVLGSELTSLINVKVPNPPPKATEIIILQANTYGNQNHSTLGSGFPKSAIELYNISSSPINLGSGNYYLHIGNATIWTHAIKLTGTVPAKTSYLIVSSNGTTNTLPRAAFPVPDQESPFGDIANDNFKIAILKNRDKVLSVENPYTEESMYPDYIDMFGAKAAAGEGTSFNNSGRPRVGRRASLIDTNNNNVDFVTVDYTATGQAANPIDLNKVWPSSIANGAWDPILGTPIIYTGQ